MKILFVGLRNKKHSSAGGYDKISMMPNTSLLSSENYPFADIPLGDLSGKYKCIFFYRILRRINILFPQILSHFYRWKYDITHLYYDEFIIPFWPYLKSKKHKVVLTVHLDIESYRFPKLFVENFKRLNGLIVLSSQQVRILKEKYNLDAKFIPHGFFRPVYSMKSVFDNTGKSIDNNFVNLFVAGNNYRDIDTLIAAITYVERECIPIRFHLVGMSSDVKMKMYNHKTVYIYNRLSDDEYFSLLSSCDYNFLPLLFATANNTLLEAQFCGVVSILPKIGGILDYSAPEPLNIFYRTRDELFVNLSSLKKISSKNKDIMKFAEQFEWKNIYAQLLDYYNSL